MALSGVDWPGAVYTAVLPSSVQVHRRLVRYRIMATDNGGRAVRPCLTRMIPAEFAFFVYDGVPAWTGAIQPNSADSARSTPSPTAPMSCADCRSTI